MPVTASRVMPPARSAASKQLVMRAYYLAPDAGTHYERPPDTLLLAIHKQPVALPRPERITAAILRRSPMAYPKAERQYAKPARGQRVPKRYQKRKQEAANVPRGWPC